MSEIAQRSATDVVIAGIRSDKFKQQISLALPGNVTAERFIRVAVTGVQMNPDIVTANHESIVRALIRCAQDGLLPDGREAALVKFKDEAVYMPMIGGFRKIAAEHGWSIDTQVVYQNDSFDYRLGLNPTLLHAPPKLTDPRGRGEPIGAYAVGTHADGRKQVEVMTAADINKVRAVSRSGSRGPWTDWTERMWEKTAGRRLFAKLPLGGREAEQERVARVITASDEDTVHPGEPTSSVEEANLSAAASGVNARVPDDGGPDDGPLTGEIVNGNDEEHLFEVPESAR